MAPREVDRDDADPSTSPLRRARECTSALIVVSPHHKSVSGSALDRIDFHLDVPPADYDKLTDDRLDEPPQAIRLRVEKARRPQRQRLEGAALTCNADIGPAQVREHCHVDETGQSLLRPAMEVL